MQLSASAIPFSLMVLAVATPVRAQDASAISPETRKYFDTISGAAQETEQGSIMPMADDRVSAGYYRIVVSRNAAVPFKITKPVCKSAFADSDALLDLIFDKQTEAGLTLRVPLSAPIAAGTQPEKFAEVNLFRIRRDGNQGCSTDLSYFDVTTEKFEGPLVRIDHAQRAVSEKLEIEYKPWLNVKANKGRVDAFWTGITGFVNWVVPIAPMLGLGNSDAAQADELGVRRQSKSFLSFLDDVKTPEGLRLTQDIMINPTSGTTHSPVGRKFLWQLAPAVAFDFTTKIEYRGSIFVEGPTYPDWSAKNTIHYYNLVNGTTYPGLFDTAKKWGEISDGVKNLVEIAAAKDVATFDAACRPALADMARFGLSPEDQFIMVYAAAKGIAEFTDMKITNINCLQVPEARAAFSRFKIPTPTAAPPNLPKMGEDHIKRLFDASYGVLKYPQSLGSDDDKLKFTRFVSGDGIRVIGDRTLLGASNGSALFDVDGDMQSPVTTAAFLDAIKSMKFFVKAGCSAPRRTDSGNVMATITEFPQGSGSPPARDRIVAHLAKRSDGKMLLVLWGVKGVDADEYPQVTQLWISDRFDASDPTLVEIKQEMLRNGSCTGDPEFNTFLTQ